MPDTSSTIGIRNKKRSSNCAKRRRVRSPSPPGAGPCAFGRKIRKAQFPPKVRASANVTKYDGSMNPSVWLEDYRLACCMVGIKDDHLVIQFLLVHLTEGVTAWLEHLPAGTIHDWADLRRAFIGNF